MKKRYLTGKTIQYFTKTVFFTDDTVQSLAIGIAAITKMDYGKVLNEICSKYLFVGYGGNFHRWLRNPFNSSNDSWRNGVAMRVAALGELAETSAVCTHDSEEGKKVHRLLLDVYILQKKI